MNVSMILVVVLCISNAICLALWYKTSLVVTEVVDVVDGNLDATIEFRKNTKSLLKFSLLKIMEDAIQREDFETARDCRNAIMNLK